MISKFLTYLRQQEDYVKKAWSGYIASAAMTVLFVLWVFLPTSNQVQQAQITQQTQQATVKESLNNLEDLFTNSFKPNSRQGTTVGKAPLDSEFSFLNDSRLTQQQIDQSVETFFKLYKNSDQQQNQDKLDQTKASQQETVPESLPKPFDY